MLIPVIDIFAGPGGLSEGFSSLRNSEGKSIFHLCLSIEKDQQAHKTLELRSFFRQFPDGEAPEEYYQYLRNEGITRDHLFSKYKKESEQARVTAWQFELSENNALQIDKRIKEALKGKNEWVLLGGPPCQAYSLIGKKGY